MQATGASSSVAFAHLSSLSGKRISTIPRGGSTVKPENSINYYYATLALRLLLEQGLLSKAEHEKICRYNAEIFRPEREYI